MFASLCGSSAELIQFFLFFFCFSIKAFFQFWVLQRDNWMTKQYFDCQERNPTKEAWDFKKSSQQDFEKLKRARKEGKFKWLVVTQGGWSLYYWEARRGKRKDSGYFTASWTNPDDTSEWSHGMQEHTERHFSWCKTKSNYQFAITYPGKSRTCSWLEVLGRYLCLKDIGISTLNLGSSDA